MNQLLENMRTLLNMEESKVGLEDWKPSTTKPTTTTTTTTTLSLTTKPVPDHLSTLTEPLQNRY